MKLAGFEYEIFLKHSDDSTKSVNDLLDNIENLNREGNAKQPDGMKLDFDMKIAKLDATFLFLLDSAIYKSS